ncbi:hypothetical protein NB693_23250 [Pantoea ananatis]|uniref:hypothetical protein n=1 Tax=Pantoea ananas TaxID=553 RepID=UPI00221FA9BE|nr:hypothetical protein [Pantoea ananatis]
MSSSRVRVAVGLAEAGYVVAAIGAAVPALFVLASGITLLQVAANPYISLIGAPGSTPRPPTASNRT